MQFFSNHTVSCDFLNFWAKRTWFLHSLYYHDLVELQWEKNPGPMGLMTIANDHSGIHSPHFGIAPFGPFQLCLFPWLTDTLYDSLARLTSPWIFFAKRRRLHISRLARRLSNRFFSAAASSRLLPLCRKFHRILRELLETNETEIIT